MKSALLGVNIDHVATLRQARGTCYPSVVQAALVAEEAGADGITLHLREDRRHIQDYDVRQLRELLQTRMNLEMAVTEEMVDFACSIKPRHCCLVPEKREELTTEGGLDVVGGFDRIQPAVQALMAQDIDVSLFIDPDREQIIAAKETGASTIEIHTGAYAEASSVAEQQRHLAQIEEQAEAAFAAGLVVNAGHGLHYHNVLPIAAMDVFHELNIGHAIIARSVFSGLYQAVADMKALLREARA